MMPEEAMIYCLASDLQVFVNSFLWDTTAKRNLLLAQFQIRLR